MKIGAEPKKLAVLGGLVVLGGYLFYSNVLSDSPAAPVSRGQAPDAGAAAPPALVTQATGALPAVRRSGSRSRTGEEWHPSLKRRPDDKTDPMAIDPTLRLDLLAKVQEVSVDGGSRNVFQFSAAPPPPLPKGPEPKVMPKIPPKDGAKAANKTDSARPKPPPPPINLKYYGYSGARGAARKTAFFLDGDEILVAGEGETVKRRYKVVKIGINSVVMEDTESKSQQTLPLAAEAVG